MCWADLLFLHWRVDPGVMRALVPPEFELDLFDGSAWVGLVPFRMQDTRFRGVPPLPGLGAFEECNVRTYVRRGGQAGVWFFSLDAASRLSVLGGRWFWGLNYVHSRFDVKRNAGSGECDYALERLRGPWPPGRTRIVWRAGEALPPSGPGSLEHFLVERYALFTLRRGRALVGRVRHDPWPLHRADLIELDDTLVRAAGIDPIGEPVALATPGVRVLAEPLSPA